MFNNHLHLITVKTNLHFGFVCAFLMKIFLMHMLKVIQNQTECEKCLASVLSFFYTDLLSFQHLYLENVRNLTMLDGVNSVEYVGGFCSTLHASQFASMSSK